LATRGAQIVLLTQHAINDYFLVDYIDRLRHESGNELITAEQVDLSNLHSIRTFATKWIDNAPPRRLDMIVLCANTITPRGHTVQSTGDGVELNWGVNYLANFHLLSILSPALRAQPPDREVRVIFGSCISYLAGQLPNQLDDKNNQSKKKTTTVENVSFSPGAVYASSKLALMTFAFAFQKHLSSYSRPDKQPMNTRVILVDPGFCRTPGMRRYLTWGSLIGLALYLITYPFWWLVLKSPEMGAQSFLYAAMEAEYGHGEGSCLIKECRKREINRDEIMDEAEQKKLWEYSETMVLEAEKRGAKVRAEKKASAKRDASDPVVDQTKVTTSNDAEHGETTVRSRRKA